MKKTFEIKISRQFSNSVSYFVDLHECAQLLLNLGGCEPGLIRGVHFVGEECCDELVDTRNGNVGDFVARLCG